MSCDLGKLRINPSRVHACTYSRARTSREHTKGKPPLGGYTVVCSSGIRKHSDYEVVSGVYNSSVLLVMKNLTPSYPTPLVPYGDIPPLPSLPLNLRKDIRL